MTIQDELLSQVAAYNQKLFPGAQLYLLLTDYDFALVLSDGVFATYYQNNYYDMAEIMSTNSLTIEYLVQELHRVWNEFIKEMEQ